VGAVYLAGKLACRLRDVLLLILVAGFVALLLNPLVGGLYRPARRLRRTAARMNSAATVTASAISRYSKERLTVL
jgi:hypothetical protein